MCDRVNHAVDHDYSGNRGSTIFTNQMVTESSIEGVIVMAKGRKTGGSGPITKLLITTGKATKDLPRTGLQGPAKGK